MRSRNVLVVPWLGLVVYYGCSLANLFGYLRVSTSGLSGESYSGYIYWQLWLNPMVRIPNEVLGIPGGVLEHYLLKDLMPARPELGLGYFLYSVAEIATLDMVLGGLAWLVLLTIAATVVRRRREGKLLRNGGVGA